MTTAETTAKAKVIITGKTLYCVEVIQGDATETVWGDGLLEDAIITARAEAEERGASNAEAWAEFHAKHVCAAHDDYYYDYVERMILRKESCLDSRWGFDPAMSVEPPTEWDVLEDLASGQSYWFGETEVRVMWGYDGYSTYLIWVNGEVDPVYFSSLRREATPEEEEDDKEEGPDGLVDVDPTDPDDYTSGLNKILIDISGVGL